MKINGTPHRTIWPTPDGNAVEIIDQTKLPHRFEIARLGALADAVQAIKEMLVRGAPLIGATAAYGIWLAMRENASDAGLSEACQRLYETRPTAVNLRWALDAARKSSPLLPRPSGRMPPSRWRAVSVTRTWRSTAASVRQV